jgi:hypothetical protein
MAMWKMGDVAPRRPDYLAGWRATRPDRFDSAAIRWHGRFEPQSHLTLRQSQFALAALWERFAAGTRSRPSVEASAAARATDTGSWMYTGDPNAARR